jgi:two-component system OmpR family sensor kinase
VQYLSASPIASEPEGGPDADAPLALPVTLKDGVQTVMVEDEPFRVWVKTLESGKRIAVAQETEMRNEIARSSAFRTLMPFLILLPILLLVVADLVRNMLSPIAALSSEIDERCEQALHPFAAGTLPSEVRPFVVAINRLLGARLAFDGDPAAFYCGCRS